MSKTTFEFGKPFVENWGSMSQDLKDKVIEMVRQPDSALTEMFIRVIGEASLHEILAPVSNVYELNTPENNPPKEQSARPIEVSPEMRVVLEQLAEIHGISVDAVLRRAGALMALLDEASNDTTDQSE